MAVRIHTGKNTLLMNPIDYLFAKKTAECCYQVDGDVSQGDRRKKHMKKSLRLVQVAKIG